MKQIGIKLADGSFYPIMEEGKPVKKTLGLTTVNDNQTRVIVDVYRSKTGTMEDAEYVDSLQIDNLVAHPNGTADINLNIGLDENNKLHAEMDDPETGAVSNASVTLVSRTLEERLEPTNYDVKLEQNPQGNQEEESLDDLLDDSETPQNTEENSETEKDVENDSAAETEEFELPEFPEENPLEEPVADETENAENQTQDFSGEDFDLPDFEENAPADEEISVPVAEENAEPLSEPEITDFESEKTGETENADSESEEKSEDSNTGVVAAAAGAGAALGLLGAANLLKKKEDEKAEKTEEAAETEEIPDSTAENSAEPAEEEINATPENSEDSDSTVAAEETEQPAENADSTVTADTSDSPFDEFDLPDFDADSSPEPENDEKSVLDDDAFFDSITTDDENSEKTEPSDDASTFVKDNTPSNGINFDGLYDKETVAGTSSDSAYENESEEIKKKTKVPVIICIICAIICILATLLILFVVPSKYNLLHKNGKAKTEVTEVQEIEPEISEIPEETQEPVVIEPKEEEIVIAPEPEQVIPEPPEEPETKPADITYKIKWGDTLWDIADSYYKNPWNYKKIARYNNIKNPDYIISGTTITIPAK